MRSLISKSGCGQFVADDKAMPSPNCPKPVASGYYLRALPFSLLRDCLGALHTRTHTAWLRAHAHQHTAEARAHSNLSRGGAAPQITYGRNSAHARSFVRSSHAFLFQNLSFLNFNPTIIFSNCDSIHNQKPNKKPKPPKMSLSQNTDTLFRGKTIFDFAKLKSQTLAKIWISRNPAMVCLMLRGWKSRGGWPVVVSAQFSVSRYRFEARRTVDQCALVVHE